MSTDTTIQLIVGFLGSMAGAGPWGILAMVLGILGVGGGAAYMIGKWNSRVDAGDLERAGADAGNSAVALKNQADANREFVDKARQEILDEKFGKKP